MHKPAVHIGDVQVITVEKFPIVESEGPVKTIGQIIDAYISGRQDNRGEIREVKVTLNPSE